MRDITLESTEYFDFTTRAFATGIPTVLAGSPVLSVLEENNATPITDGVSVSVDRASVVGLNMATVVATAANGYEAGKSYSIYISTGTVGGVSVVGEIVGQFTVGEMLKPTTAGRTLDVSATGSIELCDTITTYTGNTVQTGDSFARIGAAGASLTDLGGMATAMKAEVNAECDTALTDYNGPTSAELVTEINSVQTDIAALNDISVADILTTQMTESYAANGTAPTLAQAQFALHQMLMEFAIASTSITVKKLDSTTTAFVVTLDDATNPTSATR